MKVYVVLDVEYGEIQSICSSMENAKDYCLYVATSYLNEEGEILEYSWEGDRDGLHIYGDCVLVIEEWEVS